MAESDWTDHGASCTLARRMFALPTIATKYIAAQPERSVVVCAWGGNAMTFDLPRGS